MPNKFFLVSKIESFNRIFKEYLHKLDCMDKQYRQEVNYTTYGKGGEAFHRGYYTPSLSRSIMISNASCGWIDKCQNNKVKYTMQYGFDRDNRLILVDRLCYLDGIQIIEESELLIYLDEIILSIGYKWDKVLQQKIIMYISESVYFENKIMSYTYGSYGMLEPLCWILNHERNIYIGNNLVASNLQELTYDPIHKKEILCTGGDVTFEYQDSSIVCYVYKENSIIEGGQTMSRLFKGTVPRKKTLPDIGMPVGK